MKNRLPKHRFYSFCRPVILCLLLFSLALFSKEAVAQNLAVGIDQGVTSGTVKGSNISLTDGSGRIVQISGENSVYFSGGGVQIGGKSFSLPIKMTSSEMISWAKTRYRGVLRLIAAPTGFTVVNDIDIENYLRGILKIEMNPDWPPEALKAQAILARTYALRNKKRHQQQGFDLCSLSHCQNYRGANAETDRTDLAVNATKGQILTWNGSVADVYYHSDSGGATSDIVSVWGKRTPYLVTRTEPVVYTSPNSNWTARLTASQIESALTKMGQPVGALRSVQILERDGSGRVTLLEIQGSLRTQRVKGHALRMALGSNLLKSTNFNIVLSDLGNIAAAPAPISGTRSISRSISLKTDPLVEMTQQGIFSSKELMDMLLHPENRDKYMEMAQARLGGKMSMPMTDEPSVQERIPVPQSGGAGGIQITGKGWGHGVGLSQWGAKALAEQGWSYQRILEHYFPGTRITP